MCIATSRATYPERFTPVALALSGAVLAVSVAAIAVLCTVGANPTPSALQLKVWGSIGGTSFLTFATLSVRTYSLRKRALEEAKWLERLTHPVVQTEIEVIEDSQLLLVEPLAAMKNLEENIFPPLIHGLHNALRELILAHGRCTENTTKAMEKAVKLDRAFQHSFYGHDSLLSICLRKPEIYLLELLSYFGRGKTKESVATRRLIAAFNSGNPDKIAQATAEYEGMRNGHDLREVEELLRTHGSLADFFELMKGHFSINDDKLYGIGCAMLDLIAERVQDNAIILEKFRSLEADVEQIETFLQEAFKAARFNPEEIRTFSEECMEHMVETQFISVMRRVLAMVAKNIRLLPSLFEQGADHEQLFPEVQVTHLVGESGEFFNEETRDEWVGILEAQEALNHTIDDQAARIAFLKQDALTAYRELCPECTVDDTVEAPAGYVALRVHISDHPFKQIRAEQDSKYAKAESWWLSRSTVNSIAGWLLGHFEGFIIKLAKPGIMKLLPQMGPGEKARFEELIESTLKGMFLPVFDGSINTDSPYNEHFQAVINGAGATLAARIDVLVKKPELTHEDIRDVLVVGFDNLAKGFRRIHE